jgi:hypothetical protein
MGLGQSLGIGIGFTSSPQLVMVALIAMLTMMVLAAMLPCQQCMSAFAWANRISNSFSRSTCSQSLLSTAQYSQFNSQCAELEILAQSMMGKRVLTLFWLL